MYSVFVDSFNSHRKFDDAVKEEEMLLLSLSLSSLFSLKLCFFIIQNVM